MNCSFLNYSVTRHKDGLWIFEFPGDGLFQGGAIWWAWFDFGVMEGRRMVWHRVTVALHSKQTEPEVDDCCHMKSCDYAPELFDEFEELHSKHTILNLGCCYATDFQRIAAVPAKFKSYIPSNRAQPDRNIDTHNRF